VRSRHCRDELVGILERQPEIRRPWFKGEVQATLGAVLAAQGSAMEAEKLLLAGYEGLRGVRSTPPPRLRAAIQGLVSFYAARGAAGDQAIWRTRLMDLDARTRAIRAGGAAPGPRSD